MKKIFKNLVLCIMSVCLLSGAISVSAADGKMIGLSTDEPVKSGIFVPFDINRPTNSWDISDKGRYSFDGESDHSTLYTNYLFYGKTNYKIWCFNERSANLTIKVHSGTFPYPVQKTVSIPEGNKSNGNGYSFTYNTGDSDEKFYLEFVAPCNAWGYVYSE